MYCFVSIERATKFYCPIVTGSSWLLLHKNACPHHDISPQFNKMIKFSDPVILSRLCYARVPLLVDSFISCTPCSGYDIASQDSNLDDDVLALSGSDSDILETIEKADFVDCSTLLAGSEGDVDTWVAFI